jgi:hypothetical protein
MRNVMFLAAVLVACSKAETPAADTGVAAAASVAPTPLTAADIAGNWSGTSMTEGSDSVVNRWTAVRVSDSTGKLAMQGAKDSIPYTVTYAADSMVATSAAHADPAAPRGPKVVFRSVGRLRDGRLVGTSTTTLAAKPDSVVGRTRWEATKAP